MSRLEKKKKSKKAKSGNKRFVILLLSAIIICAVGYGVYRYVARRTHPIEYSDLIDRYSAEYSVPKDLLYATIMVESGFDEKATSQAGAMGLTQIMPNTFRWLLARTGENLSVEDLYKPEVSIKYCAVFYSILLERFQSEETAICAYHSGINGVEGWLKNPEYSSDGIHLDKIPSSVTAHYLRKITNARKTYNNLYKEELST